MLYAQCSQAPTWYVDCYSQQTEEEVVKCKVVGIWHAYAPHLGLSDMGKRQGYHGHFTGHPQRVEGDEGRVSQPQQWVWRHA